MIIHNHIERNDEHTDKVIFRVRFAPTKNVPIFRIQDLKSSTAEARDKLGNKLGM